MSPAQRRERQRRKRLEHMSAELKRVGKGLWVTGLCVGNEQLWRMGITLYQLARGITDPLHPSHAIVDFCAGGCPKRYAPERGTAGWEALFSALPKSNVVDIRTARALRGGA